MSNLEHLIQRGWRISSQDIAFKLGTQKSRTGEPFAVHFRMENSEQN